MWWKQLAIAVTLGGAGWASADPTSASPRAGLGLALAVMAFALVMSATAKAPGAKKLVALLVGLPSIALAGTAVGMSYATFGVRSKQADAKTQLAALYAAEQRYFAHHHRYTSDPAELDWKPEHSRYAFMLGSGQSVPADPSMTPCVTAAPPDVPVRAAETLTVAAWANIDCDPAVDVWTVSSEARVAPDGTAVPAGSLLHDREDAVYAHQP